MKTLREPLVAPSPANVTVISLGGAGEIDAHEVLADLGSDPKRLSPKLFYDARGSELFNAICETAAYYPTRSERGILNDNAGEIARAVGPDCVVFEFGPGDMSKVRLLLPRLLPSTYVGIDIARVQLVTAAEALAFENPWLEVFAVCADFGVGLPEQLPLPPGRRIAFFPGSTIGNFEPDDARAFLGLLVRMVGTDGGAIVGVDFKKPTVVLNRAYNDPEGLTRAFNLNVLTRLNRELGADFDERRFRHHAFYNEALGRVEMHLVSMVSQVVHFGGMQISFGAGESIHTENSYKYTPESFAALANEAGFGAHRLWTDTRNYFGVFFLSVT
ncbi:MAG TPA: L-histidine N(alpha)-methyltransferase [Burkholderiales bacterium]|nr:L-histidine N(alpha)-methyltransferase [Burkholderiales bacterium]